MTKIVTGPKKLLLWRNAGEMDPTMGAAMESATGAREPAKRSLLLVVLLAIAASSLFQGSRGLYESTEGRYAECARETLLSGDLDDPVLNGAYHWSKPPLTYVAIMAGMKTLGENEWGVRAYLVLCFALTVAAVYWAGSSMFGGEPGFYASLVYGCSIFPLISSNVVSADALLTLWEAMAIACFWHGIRTGRSRYVVLLWIFLGLGFLTKGPPSLLPLFGIVPAYWMLKRTGRPLPGLLSVPALAAFVAVGLSWYFWEGSHHPGLWKYWLKFELVERNLTGQAHRNPQWYLGLAMYLPILALGTLPWPILVLSKRKTSLPIFPQGRTGWKNCLSALSPEWAFLLGMVCVPLGIFLASKSKLPLYVLPLFIPMSFAYGARIHRLVAMGGLRRATVLRTAFFAVLIFVAGKAISAQIDAPQDMKTLSQRVTELKRLYPDHKVVVYKRPLNGLEFYLGTTLPVLPMDPKGGAAIKAFPVETPLLVLTRQKYAGRVLRALGQEEARILPTGKRGWIAVVAGGRSESGRAAGPS